MTEPRLYDAVLGGKANQPKPYDAVLGGKVAMAARKEKEWEIRAQQIFNVFTEASKSPIESKRRSLRAVLASIKASEADCDSRRKVYRRELENPNPTFSYEQIHQTFRHVKHLSLKWSNLSDISLLGCCPFPSLAELRIEENGIKDISAIGCFSELEELYMHNNCIKDISALRSLKNLKKLHFMGNAVTDISALKNLEKLKYLWVNQGISDIAPLKNLNLKMLYVADCPLDQNSRRIVKQFRERGIAVDATGTLKARNGR